MKQKQKGTSMDTKTLRRPETATRMKRSVPWRFGTSIEDITRRDFLIGTGGVLILAPYGCGGEEEAGGTSGETRTVEHAMGETEVPVDPRRVIVAGSYVALPTALLVDAPVVGATHIPFGEPFAAFLDEEKTRGIEDVDWNQVNIETIAALDPDLIIVSTFYFEEIYDEIQRVAPTVATEVVGSENDWKAAVRKISEALGEGEAADEEIAAYEERVSESGAAMGDLLDTLKVSLVNIRALGDIRIYASDFSSGQVLEGAGLKRPASQRPLPDSPSINLGIESLSEIDADAVFYFVGSSGTDPEEAAKQAERIQANPLWGQLSAVQNGRAYLRAMFSQARTAALPSQPNWSSATKSKPYRSLPRRGISPPTTPKWTIESATSAMYFPPLHDLNNASRYSDHIIALCDGTVFRAGTPAEVMTEDLLREVFGVEADIVRDPRNGIPLCIPYGLNHRPATVNAPRDQRSGIGPPMPRHSKWRA